MRELRPVARIIVVSICVCFSGGCSSTNQLFERGIDFVGSGQYERGVEIFRSLLGRGIPIAYKMPDDSDSRSLGGLLALAYIGKMQIDSAMMIAEKTLTDNSKDHTSLASLGITQFYNRDFIRAKENLQQSISLKSRFWHGYNWLASIYTAERDLEKADSVLQISIEMYSRNHIARNWLAVVKYLKGDQEGAIQEFQRAMIACKMFDELDASRNAHAAELYPSLNLICNGKFDEANIHLQRCLSRGGVPGVYYFLGVLNLFKDNKLAATEYFHKESRGVFRFLSTLWLMAIYANDGEIHRYFEAYGYLPKSLQ